MNAEPITKDNMISSINFMTVNGSAVLNFHQTLNNFYIPSLLSHEIGREPEVQKTLKVLDHRLKIILYQSKKAEPLRKYFGK